MNKLSCLAGMVVFGLGVDTGWASDLSLDGGTAAHIAYGDSFLIEVAGGSGLPAFLFADSGPGPSLVLGELVPLSLSPTLFLVYSGTTDASGTWSVSFPTPSNPAISGAKFYMGGYVLDPSDSNGVDFTNGAVLNIGPIVGAGPDQAGLVGQRVVLDGSGASLAGGSIPAGAVLDWQVLQAPGGSSASLSAGYVLYPTFTPDVPGDFLFELTVTHGGVQSSEQTTLHAWDLDLGAGVTGKYFSGGTAPISGALVGPTPASFTLDGAPVALDGAGNFGPLAVPLDTSGSLDGLLFEVTHADGTSTRSRQTVGLGTPEWVAFGAAQSAMAHLDQEGFVALSKGTEQSLEETDLAPLITSIPAAQVANEEGLFGFTIFSATIKFTNMNIDQDMTVTLVPNANNVRANVRLTGVKVDFDVWGELLEISYNLNGDSTSSAVDIGADLLLSTSGGDLDLDVSNVSVSLTNFQFDLHGFLGDVAQVFLLESWVKETVVDTMEAEIGSQIGPIVLEMLSAFEFSLDLGPDLGLETTVDLDFVSASHQASGVTLGLDTKASVGAAKPGAPGVPLYRTTPSAAPGFGALTPTGQTYGGALAANDDFLNLILAALTEAGLLEGDLTELFPEEPGGGPGTVLTTDSLGVLFPGAGFQNFPSGTVVEMVSHGVMPPIVTTSPSGPGLLVMELAGMEVSLEIPTPEGAVPVLRLVLDGKADLDMIVEPDGTLGATLVSSTFTPTVLSGFPGSNVTSLQAGSDFLVQTLLPQLTSALGVIPVPSLDQEGVTLTTDEVHLTGAGSQFMGFWGNMFYVPPAP
jgi:hypothetical protein